MNITAVLFGCDHLDLEHCSSLPFSSLDVELLSSLDFLSFLVEDFFTGELTELDLVKFPT